MNTLKPFLLSSLALHLLGVGLLLFWMLNPPAGPNAEVKVLTVMLVSDDRPGRGLAGEEPGLKSKPPAFSPPALEPGPRPKVDSADGSPGPAKILTVPASSSPEEKTVARRGPESAGVGVPGGSGNSPTAAGQLARVPGAEGGSGAGAGYGNGWGPGAHTAPDDRLHLKGGYQITPAYPASARRQGREGTALLKIKVSPEGKVQEVWVDRSSGHQDLDEAAVEAVKAWRFEPPQKGGQGVSVWARVPVKFQLRK